MATTNRSWWTCGLWLLAALAVPAALTVYLLYFTPGQRAVRNRLDEADDKAKAAIDVRLKPLSELFAKGRQGAKAFAEAAMSWESKWHLVKGIVEEGSSHRFLSDAFAEHIFSQDDLRNAIESVVRAYLLDIEGFENEMLVQLRADLVGLGIAETEIPALRGDAEFRRSYEELSRRLVNELRIDLGVTVGCEVGMLIATEVITQIALQAVKAAASEMGVSAGVLSSGAASGAATLGVGLIVSLIIDYLLDVVLKALGHDPEAKIEALVIESLDKLEAALTRDRDLEFWKEKGALRARLEEVHDARSRLRRETIRRLLKEGGMR